MALKQKQRESDPYAEHRDTPLSEWSAPDFCTTAYESSGWCDLAGAVEKFPKNMIERTLKTADAGFSCCKVATQTGNLGNYQELSDGTGDQSGRLSPLRDGERKDAEQGVTRNKSAHKKEPPMRLELMTYALRKRRSAN